MPDDVFRIVITVGVALAAISFVFQSVAMFAMYRVVAKMRQKVEPIAERVPPLIATVNAAVEQSRPLIGKAGPLLDTAKATIAKANPILEQAAPAMGHVKQILANANRVLEDARPKISEIGQEAVGIAHEGREAVERVGAMVSDASQKARTRLEQIDRTVESTVEQVEHAGDTMKKAVMRPVREVNGIAAGISAAVSTLVKGPRKSPVDSATQDEEMFI